jgi:aspartyl-tRNA(Asn)/glutamyl-tRNA(Gln) amidotransferase subunit C
MSNFTDLDFEHLSKLCKLEFSPEEKAELFDSVQKVLGYVEQLNEVDTEGVPSCNFVLRTMLKNQLREDEVKGLLLKEQFLANAPDQIGGMVRVPSVMKAPQ